jgi:acylphosphatase
MVERLHVIVDGYVQGVGFRAFVLDQARKAGVSGWVRNRWDISVEVCAEGERSILEGFLEVLKRGPAAANVREVHAEWQAAGGEFTDFRVRSSL